jgi:hypothetical protein
MRFAIRNLNASRVNLLMNDYTAGLPSPMAFLGLAEAVGRSLGIEPWSARVLPILHAVHASQGRTKPEMIAKSGVFGPSEIVEDMHGIVDVSLLIDLPGVSSASAVEQAMHGKTIAGGVVANAKIDVAAVAADGEAFRGFRRGYAMLRPDAAERRIIASGELREIERIAKIIFPAEREPGRGWIVPVAVGHRLLEDPASVPKRSRTRRGDIPHVFVEPCLGIAELISVRNARLVEADENLTSDRLWAWSAEGDFVLGHPAYQPTHH